MGIKCPKCQHENPDDTLYCGKCGIPLEHPEDISVTKTLETQVEQLDPGSTLANRYKIIEELGKGGMGRVYRVHDIEIVEEVALKLIKSEIASDENTIERFRNELKIARKVSHKNVCRMYDIGREDEKYFITMEYVEGEDLKSLIRKKGNLSTEEAIGIAQQVCEGLSEAHELGVVHRDLKPQNIMIDEKGRAKIMDFGIARSVEAPGVTQTGVIIGTPDYISPEQAEGEKADQRSDIYTLGVILYEMVTGSVPFKGDTAFSVALKHKTQLPQDPRKLNSQLSDDLARLILACMEKEKERRYQTAVDLLADLRNIEEGLPLGTKIKPRRKAFAANITRLRKYTIPAIGMTVLIAVVIGLLKFVVQKESLSPIPMTGQPSVAILYFRNNTGERDYDIWREGLSLSLMTKLSLSQQIRVLDQSQIYSILKRLNLLKQDNLTQEDLKKIASGSMASHIVRGNLSRAGEKFRIDLTLQNASTMEIILSESADGIGEGSLFALVDSLAERLKTGLGLTAQQATGELSKKIGDVTTTSIEAFKYYVQGQQLYNAGDFNKAISFFKKAVAIDPQFAMAYLWMGLTFWLTDWKECRLSLQKAFDSRERVSERERLLIEAEYFQRTSEKTWDKAIDSFSKLIAIYPWDLRASGDLAFLYWMMDEWDEAIKQYEVLRRYKDDSIVVYQMLAWSYLSKGQTEKAREVYEEYLSTFGNNAFIHGNLGMVYCIEENYEKAGAEIEKAFLQAPESSSFFKYFYLLCIEDFVSVEELIQKMESSQPAGCVGYRSMSLVLQGKIKEAGTRYDSEIIKWQDELDLMELAHIFCDFSGLLEGSGDFSGAFSACEMGLQKAEEVGLGKLECIALYRRGVIQAKVGQFKEAEQTAQELLRRVEGGLAKKRFRYLEALLGAISLQKKDFVSAQDHLQKALSLESINDGIYFNLRSEFLDYLGQAYKQAGQLLEAKKTYENILSSRRGSLSGYSAGALVFAKSHYKLGVILELLGDKNGAIERYNRFLDLWKDADRGIAEVEDAKERLARLQK